MFTSDEERPYVCADPPTVQVEAGKTAEAIVELGEGILVRGRFLDAKTGQAIPNSHVWATTGQVSSGFDGVPAKMDEDGSWFAIFPREGKYTLNYCIQRTTQQPVKHGEIDVRRDETMKEIAIRVEQQE
ncbi:hypothetical protein JW916_13745 [Candidatus Sumerlaeota bacterium]|nr:hypothetical protein [Candidatus Sumerlaeota bacterium]